MTCHTTHQCDPAELSPSPSEAPMGPIFRIRKSSFKMTSHSEEQMVGKEVSLRDKFSCCILEIHSAHLTFFTLVIHSSLLLRSLTEICSSIILLRRRTTFNVVGPTTTSSSAKSTVRFFNITGFSFNTIARDKILSSPSLASVILPFFTFANFNPFHSALSGFFDDVNRRQYVKASNWS